MLVNGEEYIPPPKSKAETLVKALTESAVRFPLANKGDAMHLMRLWSLPYHDAPAKREWHALTGEDQVTTKVLWDYIRASIMNEGY
jgi:hypothetical protein